MTILICGAGIAGLTLGLSLHQVGVPFRIFERVTDPKPLGVGINLQPNAVRELFDCGLEGVLDQIGVRTKDYGFYTRTGIEIWTEPRGTYAGYNWPQFSVHRGRLQMSLLEALAKRAGPDCISTGHRLTYFENTSTSVNAYFQTADGVVKAGGDMLVGADGIHSAVRKTMYPEEGAPVWGGAIMWRGTTLAEPFLSGASMILAGNNSQRFVSYPISGPDAKSGLASINWIAEKSVDPNSAVSKEDWNREVGVEQFLSDFENWNFGWLNVPWIIERAEKVYEYPMVDREPVNRWTIGPVTMIGDAAHATYPVGSSGASQAIVDARILTSKIAKLGPGHQAAIAYEEIVRPMANAVTIANRGSGGPDAIMQMAEDRCAGDFSKIDDKLPIEERKAHALQFKRLAGLTIEELNAKPSLITKHEH